MAVASYYFLRLEGLPHQVTAYALQQKDGAYLSPHGRVAALPRAAAFRSGHAAELCRDLWMERLQHRWGSKLQIEVECWSLEGTMRDDSLAGPVTLLARARCGRFSGP